MQSASPRVVTLLYDAIKQLGLAAAFYATLHWDTEPLISHISQCGLPEGKAELLRFLEES